LHRTRPPYAAGDRQCTRFWSAPHAFRCGPSAKAWLDSLPGAFTINDKNPEEDDDAGPTGGANDPNILPYGTHSDQKLVKLRSFGSAEQAELVASVLSAEGIRTQILGEHANSLGFIYQGFAGVDLMVQADDASRAAEILARTTEDLEPVDEAPSSAPTPESDQKPAWVVAGAFASVRAMLDAQVVLASANIPSVVPALAPRGDRPPGTGKRFKLRVAFEDLERAQSLLGEQDDSDEPRCPKCGSWRVYPDATWIETLADIAGLGRKPAEKYQCLACKYRGGEAEFFGRA
jgi:hypothetical protein